MSMRMLTWVSGVCLGLAVGSADAAQQATPPDDPATRYLKLSLDELMNVEVTSVSKRPEKLSESPSAIQVIQGDDIRRAGASRLPEALRLVSNLQVAQKNAHDWGISARGFNTELANKLLVLIDGRTVYTPLFSGVFWDAQDYLLEDLDRIEVISGPGGTLWGANAVNGVINITTKPAGETQGLYLEGGGGTQLRDFVGARFGAGPSASTAFRLYGKYFERDAETLPGGGSAGDAWHSGRGGFRLDANPSQTNRLTVQGGYQQTRADVPTGGRSRLSGFHGLGRWSHTRSASSDFSLQVYFDRAHLFLPRPAAGSVPAGPLADDLDTLDLDFQHRVAKGDLHRFVWGFGYRFTSEQTRNSPSLRLEPTSLDRSLGSAFVQDEIRLASAVFATLGTKVEHNDYTGFELEPSVRLQWNARPSQTFWTAISRAVRTPSRIDRDFSQPTGLPAPLPAVLLRGSSTFVSETVIAYEAGWRTRVGGKVGGSIAVFHNRYDHLRSTTPGPAGFPSFGFPLTFENNLEGNASGTEISATWQPVRTARIGFGHSFLNTDLHVKPGRVDFSNTLNETADPEHQLFLRASFDLPRNVAFDASFRWIDSLVVNNGPNPGRVPSYAQADARLGIRPSTRFEFALVGQNLLGGAHPEHGFPGATRVEVGRNVYAMLVYRRR